MGHALPISRAGGIARADGDRLARHREPARESAALLPRSAEDTDTEAGHVGKLARVGGDRLLGHERRYCHTSPVTAPADEPRRHWLSRIRIEGVPITDVFGNIHSSHCGAAQAPSAMPGMPAGTSPSGPITPVTNPAGDVVLECDRDKGEIYIRPVGDSQKPINLFISSATATYTSLLRRAITTANMALDKADRHWIPVQRSSNSKNRSE